MPSRDRQSHYLVLDGDDDDVNDDVVDDYDF